MDSFARRAVRDGMRHRLLPTLLAGIAISMLAGSASASAASFAVTAPDDVNDGLCDAGTARCARRSSPRTRGPPWTTSCSTSMRRSRRRRSCRRSPSGVHQRGSRTGRCTGDVAPLHLTATVPASPGWCSPPGRTASKICLATIGGFRTGSSCTATATRSAQQHRHRRFGIAAEPNSFAGIASDRR